MTHEERAQAVLQDAAQQRGAVRFWAEPPAPVELRVLNVVRPPVVGQSAARSSCGIPARCAVAHSLLTGAGLEVRRELRALAGSANPCVNLRGRRVVDTADRSVPSTQYCVLSTRYWELVTRYSVIATHHPSPSTLHPPPITWDW